MKRWLILVVVLYSLLFAGARYVRRKLQRTELKPPIELTVEKDDRVPHPAGRGCLLTYRLSIRKPQQLYANSDGEVVIYFRGIELERDCPGTIDGGYLELQLISEPFKVVPTGDIQLPIRNDVKQNFLITAPEHAGERKLMLVSTFSKFVGRDPPMIPFDKDYSPITVTVESPPAFLGMSEATLKKLETISTIIGLPTILLLLIKIVLSKRRVKSAIH